MIVRRWGSLGQFDNCLNKRFVTITGDTISGSPVLFSVVLLLRLKFEVGSFMEIAAVRIHGITE